MNRIEHLLVILGEEASEVSKEAAKCLRFSPEEIYEPIGISNAARVLEELYDLSAIVEMLQLEGVLPGYDPAMVRKKIEAKKEKVEKHLLYSKRCGTLNE